MYNAKSHSAYPLILCSNNNSKKGISMKISKYLQICFFAFFLLFGAQTYAANKATDIVITGKIKAKIALDPAVSVFKTDVSTTQGVVFLSGQVNSDTDAAALIEIAQATDGVQDVNATQLTVNYSKQPFADIAITAKVKGILIREKIFGKDVPATKVNVETNNGVVYLSGRVDTQQQATNAIYLAKSIDGVKQVESRIKVGNES